MPVDMNKLVDLDRLKEYKTTENNGIAPIETTSTASKAYKTGERFYFQGKLCIATNDIAQGGTITLNTNCKLDVLGDDVSALQTAIAQLEPEVEAQFEQKTIENVAIASFDDGADNVPIKKLVVGIEPVQSGSGDPSPTNVRPITGWTGANVTRTGKNLFDSNAVTNNSYLSVTTGLPEAQTGYVVSDYIPVIKNQGVIIPASGTARRWFYDKNKNPITYLNNSGTQLFMPTDDGYIRISVSKTTQFYSTYIVAYGDGSVPVYEFSTEYEPYSGTTYSIEFPSEAGTVYGGTLDVTNGVLTVDEVKKTFDGTETITSPDTAFARWTFTNTIPYYPDDNKLQSSHYARFQGQGANQPDNTVMTQQGAQFLQIHDAAHAPTANDYKTYLASQYANDTPVEVVYALATPITYTLTPIEVKALLGQNNIWADCGDIDELTYRAMNNTDAKIALTQAIIAPVLDSMVADTALVANDFRIVNNTLYRITTSVASGATLTPNTNCTATTIAEILKSLLT